MKRALLTIALLSAFPGPALAEPLQPTGKWVLDFAAERCFALRNYGSPKQTMYLAFKPAPAGGLIQLIVARKAVGAGVANQGRVTLRPAAGKAISTTYLVWADRSSKLRLLSVILTAAQFEAIRAAPALAVEAEGEFRREFALSALPALSKEMDVCLADLQDYWNIKPVEEPSRALPEPIHSLASLFSPGDYPGMAVRNGQSGAVQFITLIDEAGKVRDCTVTETSGIAVLDAQTCSVIMERGKFRPATSDGKPVKSWLRARIRWELPG